MRRLNRVQLHSVLMVGAALVAIAAAGCIRSQKSHAPNPALFGTWVYVFPNHSSKVTAPARESFDIKSDGTAYLSFIDRKHGSKPPKSTGPLKFYWTGGGSVVVLTDKPQSSSFAAIVSKESKIWAQLSSDHKTLLVMFPGVSDPNGDKYVRDTNEKSIAKVP